MITNCCGNGPGLRCKAGDKMIKLLRHIRIQFSSRSANSRFYEYFYKLEAGAGGFESHTKPNFTKVEGRQDGPL